MCIISQESQQTKTLDGREKPPCVITQFPKIEIFVLAAWLECRNQRHDNFIGSSCCLDMLWPVWNISISMQRPLQTSRSQAKAARGKTTACVLRVVMQRRRWRKKEKHNQTRGIPQYRLWNGATTDPKWAGRYILTYPPQFILSKRE